MNTKQKLIVSLLTISLINTTRANDMQTFAKALATSAQAELDAQETRKREADALKALSQSRNTEARVKLEEILLQKEALAAQERVATIDLLKGNQSPEDAQSNTATPGQQNKKGDNSAANPSSSKVEVTLSAETFKGLKGNFKDAVRKHADKQKGLLRKKAKYDKELSHIEHSQAMEKLALIGQGFSSLLSDKERLTNGALAIGGTALAIYLAKRSTGLLFSQAESYLRKPLLVDKTSRLDFSTAFSPSYWYAQLTGKNRLNEVVVDPALKARLDRIAHQTLNTKKHNGFLQHVLLYGQPGTGKTMFAENLALGSGMHYAILSGANLSRFSQAEGLEELRKLFAWAEKSPKGTMLFVDECEGFAKKRGGATTSEAHEKILSSWLKLTGTESKRVMLAGATNRPEDLDPAALSRFSLKVEFKLPREAERLTLLSNYYRSHVQDHVGKKKNSLATATEFTDEQLQLLVERTEGFAGRDIEKMMIRVYSIGLAKDAPSIEFADCLKAVDEMIEEKASLADFRN